MAKFDIRAHFALRAEALAHAVKQGRARHSTGDIKASGAPLEAAFRSLLAGSLPSTSRVDSGYFYGADSECSNEIDILVYEENEAFQLELSSEGQRYIPYTSVSIIGQVKNSASELSGAIDQVQTALKKWGVMQQSLQVSTGRPQENPLTFVVCGDSKKLTRKQLEATLKKKDRPFVDYILFLDRGEIIAGGTDFFLGPDEVIGFQQRRSVNALFSCTLAGDNPAGMALLWLYFALVAKLSFDRANDLRYYAFCKQIEGLYPLRRGKQLR